MKAWTGVALATAIIMSVSGCSGAATSADPPSSASPNPPTTTSESASPSESLPAEAESSTEPTQRSAQEIIDDLQVEVKKVEDKRSECIKPDAAESCAAEHVQLAMDVGRQAIRELSELTGPGVASAVTSAGKLASPEEGVACVETQLITSCFFASPGAFAAARALQRDLAALERNL